MGVVVHAACVAVDPCFAWGATTTAASCVDVVLFDRWRRAHRRLLIAPPTTLLRRVGLFVGVVLSGGWRPQQVRHPPQDLQFRGTCVSWCAPVPTRVTKVLGCLISAPAGSPAASSAQSRAGSGSVAAAGSTVGDATRNDGDDGDAEVDALIPRLQATNLTPKAKHQPSPNHGGGRGSPVAAAAPPSVPSRGAAGGRTAGAYVPPHLKTRTGNSGRGQARGSPAGGRTPPPPRKFWHVSPCWPLAC